MRRDDVGRRREVTVGPAPDRYYWRKEPIAAINQVVTDATWYYVVGAAGAPVDDVRLLYIAATHDNDEEDNRDINVRVTIDGVTLTGAANACAHMVYEYWYMWTYSDTLNNSGVTILNPGYHVDIRGQECTVEMQMPTSWGTNEILRGRVQYEVYRGT